MGPARRAGRVGVRPVGDSGARSQAVDLALEFTACGLARAGTPVGSGGAAQGGGHERVARLGCCQLHGGDSFVAVVDGTEDKRKGPGAGAARAWSGWGPALLRGPQLTGAPGGAPSTIAPIRACSTDTSATPAAAALRLGRTSTVSGQKTMVAVLGLKGCIGRRRQRRCLLSRLAQMIKRQLSVSKGSCPGETRKTSFKCGMRHGGAPAGPTSCA